MWRLAALLVIAGCGRLGFDPLARGDGAPGGDAPPGGDGPSGCRVGLGAGRLHVCAIATDGRVSCWGDGMYGQIGDGMMTDRAVPTLVPQFPDVVDVGGGRYETCVARATGAAMCWGEGDSGQLGDGASMTSPTPVMVSALTGAVDVAPAAIHSCARLASGEVWCWGSGGNGRLGDGTGGSSPVPVRVSGIGDAQALSAGGSTSCAILGDGALRCWGYNQNGEVGNNTMIDATTPEAPIGIGPVRAVSSRDNTTCAVREDDGGVMCWGRNDQGNCGTGMTSGNLLVPTQTRHDSGDPVTGAQEIAVGIDHACALIGGVVMCWGSDASGQLGDGISGGVRPNADPVVGLPTIVHIASAAYTTCAVDGGGTVWCWGQGTDGELGDGTFVTAQPTPVVAFDGCP
jgi:alpha-tubulin suppressor-like RCC1 family protein